MRRKIFFLIPNLYQGGCERVVSELSMQFAKEDDVSVVVFEDKTSYPVGGKLIDLKAPFSTNRLTHIRNFFARMWRFKKLISKERPDFVISFINTANVINVLLNKNSVLHLDMCLSVSSSGFGFILFKLFVRFWFPKAAKIVAVSKGVAKDLEINFGISSNKIQVIYNPVSCEKIQNMSKEPLPNEYKRVFDNPVIVTVGRLAFQKGHE